MKRLSTYFALLIGGLVLVSGCASDPNVEGAKLDLRNKDYERALENVNKALERSPENAEAHKLKGDILRQQATTVDDPQQHTQIINQMIESYDRAAELGMGSAVEQAKVRAYINEFKRGAQAFNRGKKNSEAYAEAVQYFQNAGQIQPDSAAAYTNTAYAMLNAGNNKEAIEPLREAIDRGDGTAQNYNLLAQLYATTNQPDQQLTVLEEASEKFPNNQDIQSQLMNAYVNAGQTEEALNRYSAAVEENPEDATLRYNYGTLLLNADRFEEAIQQFERALEIDPSYTDAQYNLGAARVNWAADISDQITELDDQMQSQESELSEAEIQDLESQIQDLDQRRKQLFGEAIPALQEARQAAEAGSGQMTNICKALFTAYVQTGQEQEAQSVAECAGFEQQTGN